MKEQLRDFLEYLRLNRNASPHTISAYESDIAQYLGFVAADAGLPEARLDPGRSLFDSFGAEAATFHVFGGQNAHVCFKTARKILGHDGRSR